MRPLTAVMTVIIGLAGYYGWSSGYHVLEQQTAWIVPPPKPDSTEAQEDRRIYFATRKSAGSLRWQQAAFEANLSDSETVQIFLNRSRIQMTPEKAKEFFLYLKKAQKLAYVAMKREKNIWQRRRPFIDYGGVVCTFNHERFFANWSYPSGHTVRAYTIALILSEMYPSRREILLKQAYEFAESRIICGMHWKSDIKGGEEFAYKIVGKIIR